MTTAADPDVIAGTADEILDPDEHGTDMIVATVAGSIIRADQPDDIITKASAIATSLAKLIEAQGLAVDVGGRRRHVEVGGWQALGTMLGALGGQPLHAETVWTRKITGDNGDPIRTAYTATVKRYYRKDQGGGVREETTYGVDGHDWEAKVEIRTPDGTIVGSAEAMCSRTENTWAKRDDFALRSMAETRAESRAYRRAAGWIVHLAGYSPTPAEELGHTPGADTRPPTWAAPAGDDVKRAMVAALQDVLAHRPTAIEAAGQLANACGGQMPGTVAAWIASLPQWRQAANTRRLQDQKTERPEGAVDGALSDGGREPQVDPPDPAPPVAAAAGDSALPPAPPVAAAPMSQAEIDLQRADEITPPTETKP